MTSFRSLVGDARRLKISPRDALRAAVRIVGDAASGGGRDTPGDVDREGDGNDVAMSAYDEDLPGKGGNPPMGNAPSSGTNATGWSGGDKARRR